jgi:hypothetical protein
MKIYHIEDMQRPVNFREKNVTKIPGVLIPAIGTSHTFVKAWALRTVKRNLAGIAHDPYGRKPIFVCTHCGYGLDFNYSNRKAWAQEKKGEPWFWIMDGGKVVHKLEDCKHRVMKSALK